MTTTKDTPPGPRPARAETLIAGLGLAPHPEGGHYREVFRSATLVHPSGGGPPRAAMTTIAYLLCRGECSRWHRVGSDEVWHFHEGDVLDLFRAPPDLSRLERVALGAAGDAPRPVEMVPGGWWQAARTRGAYSLTGCTVAPGFEFADFGFMRDVPGCVAELARLAPDLVSLA